jgi:hypothetical protein
MLSNAIENYGQMSQLEKREQDNLEGSSRHQSLANNALTERGAIL